MRKTLAAAIAVFAGIAIAAPTLVWSADDEQQAAQMGSAGATGGPGPHGGMMERMMGDRMGDDMRDGGEHHHHGWMQAVMRQPPQQRCEERLARRAGAVAYVVAKLNLTAEQRPLWDKLQAQLQANADRERQLCATLKPREQRANETLLDKMNRREQFLSARLQNMQQARPLVEQLYNALSPEQKAIADHPFRRG